MDLGKSARCAGVISSCYAADDTVSAYQAIDPTPFGFKFRDVILADELGFSGVAVGLLLEDFLTEELAEIYRGTRVILNGPDEWLVDAKVSLTACPFAPGCKTEYGFTSTENTFRLASGRPFPTVQLVSGHSLAAAWGQLRAAKLKASLISFAGPRVGDRAFSDFAQQAIPTLIRWVNHPDVVPKVPLDVWPCFEYLHAGPATEFDASAKINSNLSFSQRLAGYHSIDTYWNAVDPAHPVNPQYAA